MASSYLDQLFGMTGQVAVVIGGTGVLGGALAQGLAQAGASVVVAGRDPEKGTARVREIEAVGGLATFAPVDVMARASIEALLAGVLASHGRVDMLINGAGVNNASPYLEAKDEDWDRVFDSNLKAVHHGCQIFGKHMATNGGGSIVNIASITAHTPLSRVFAYSASKAAVINLTQNVARELAPMGSGSMPCAPASSRPNRTARFSMPPASRTSCGTPRWPGSASRASWSGPPS